MPVKKLHYFSGITLSVFIAMHLFNHFYSIFGAQQHIEMMNALRVFYRNIFIETILLLAVLIQIISGVMLFSAKFRKAFGMFDKLHIWSGLYLAVFLTVHVGVVLAGRLVLHLDTNFYFGVAGLNTFPLSLFFFPYYGLAVISVFTHIAAVHYGKMKYAFLGLSPRIQSTAIIIIGFCTAVVILYGLTNHFQGMAVPQQYHILIGK